MKPRSRVGFGLGVLLLASVFCGMASGSPDNGPGGHGGGHDGGGKKHAKVKIKAPELAIAGHRVKIRGDLKRKVRTRRVALQVKKRKRHFKTVDRGRAHGKKDRFKLRLRAPRMTGVVKVRVVAGSPRHPKAKSKRVDLPVTESEVLKSSNVVSAPAPGTAGTIVYDGKRAPKKGHYVALGVGPQTPYGLLGKVTAVDRSGHATSIAVTPASLFDAVPEGRIKMTPKLAKAASARDGGSARLRATATRASVPLACSAGASAEAGAEASLSLSPSFTLDWDTDWFPPDVSVEKAEFTATVTGTAKAYARIAAAGSCSIDKTELFQRTFSPITFTVGPVPVVLTPQLITYWSAEASASAEISTSIEGSVSATGGVRYEDGDLDPIGEFTKSFTYTQPSLRGEGSIGARVIPAANLLLYGVVGPQAELSVGPQLDVDTVATAGTADWRLHVPIELNALIVVPVFDEEWGPLTVWDEDFLLAEGRFGPPVGFWSGDRGFLSRGDFNIFFVVDDPNRRRLVDFSGLAVGNDDDAQGCLRSWGSPLDPISVDVAPDGSFVFRRPEEDVVVRGRFVSDRRVEGTFRVLPGNACGVAQTTHPWFANWDAD